MTRGTVPDKDTVIANLRKSNDKLREALMDYEAKKHSGFWRGVTVGVFGLTIATFVATKAFGETITIGRTLHVNGQPAAATTVTIEPSPEPGQLAIVTMDNALVNDAGDNGEYFIAIPGLAVGVSFTWDADGFSGSDQMVVTPPEGITCIPGDCTATVFEGMTGKVILLDWIGG
jgi:hypothetical protein